LDRPLGSRHPRHGFVYGVNDGFLTGVSAPDGGFQDAYVLGELRPIDRFVGECIAVIRRLDDAEEKLMVAPPGVSFTDDQILRATDFQERRFRSIIDRKGPSQD
jgi:inorganic pyrophosphatase